MTPQMSTIQASLVAASAAMEERMGMAAGMTPLLKAEFMRAANRDIVAPQGVQFL
jgi:hypothetical protein